MDLIPLKEDADSSGPAMLKLSEAARQLAEVKTSVILSEPATRTLRLPATVQLDETRIRHVTAWVGGRIEKLYVNYTGIPVQLNDHMAEFYSPELITAQEELIRSKENIQLHRAVIERLIRWGISSEQIEKFKKQSESARLVTINSPVSGIVIEQAVKEGMYVNQGTRLFSIADMKNLWLVAAIYERDVQWLKYGQTVECEFEAYPGRIFPGTIAFISPILSDKSRTVDARINIDNSQGMLKPGMFGRITVKVSIGNRGQVINPNLAGKWISPMHPEIVKDAAGLCDVCGMALVPVESLGISSGESQKSPLVVPESAVMWSGKRSIVFRKTNDEKQLYETVEVTLGPRVDRGYLIFDGLAEGDRVVTEGAFKLDSEQQIKAKASMMNPERKLDQTTESEGLYRPQSPEELKLLEQLLNNCLKISEHLAADNIELAKKSAEETANLTHDLSRLNNPALTAISVKMTPVLSDMTRRIEINTAREDLFRLTPAIKELVLLANGLISLEIHEDYCPMAFDNKGASWFQSATELANPYFGEMMLRCGETKKVWNPGKN